MIGSTVFLVVVILELYCTQKKHNSMIGSTVFLLVILELYCTQKDYNLMIGRSVFLVGDP